MGAQLVKRSTEALSPVTWAALTYDWKGRALLIKGMAVGLTETTHSFYEGVQPLIRDLVAMEFGLRKPMRETTRNIHVKLSND